MNPQICNDFSEIVSGGGYIVLAVMNHIMPAFLPLRLKADRDATKHSGQPKAVPRGCIPIDIEQIAVVIDRVDGVSPSGDALKSEFLLEFGG